MRCICFLKSKNRSVATATDHPYVHELGEVKHFKRLLALV
ncbi:hypothetical protein M2E15_0568 [Bacillus mycoides]|nr:hypothetical protein M2E15_0568 [Bacillus mycoides]OSY06126.1 hypothetical protein S2E19_06089 [Bacillus mycoides]OSY14756.1 hypothetical protein BTJ48_04225 [Bacillus mycoides]